MKDESYLDKPLLEDGDTSNLVPIQRSKTEKLWGILSQSPAASWLPFPSGLGYDAASLQHKSTKEKSTMTQATGSPAERSRVLILVLVLATFLLALLSVFFNLFIWPLGRQPSLSVAVPQNLSDAALLEAREREPRVGAMRDCLDKAVQDFSAEPSVVKDDARMTLQCNGTRQEFLSGNGGTRIEVVWIDGEVSYNVDEASAEVHVARLSRRPLPLSLTSVNQLLRDLASWGGLEELQGCLNRTSQKFREEPTAVQDNAKLVVSCGSHQVTFVSGEGQNEISVYRGNVYEEIQYQVKATGWAWFEKFWKDLWG
ncbi:hypothetical protein lerEdw1_010547 [Lerista edwardsae]|nr:hypothetical protein lerEdw1_010547 [Lerista edwardsae]